MKTNITFLKEPDLENAHVIEGLPGVGHVGKLAAEHLIEMLDAEKFATLHSPHLPPQVLVEDGEAQLVSIDLYAAEEENLILLIGDHQSVDNDGHYEIVETLLDSLEDVIGDATIYTLGGFGTGEMQEETRVLGAVNDSELKPGLEEAGVIFEEDKPAGGIVGASGLFLGIGRLRSIKAACLMGETSGYLVDPKAAQAVLKVLSELLDVEVDTAALEEQAEELEEFVSQVMEQSPRESPAPSREDLHYIG